MIRLIYFGGAAAVAILTLAVVLGTKIILFPESMLPMELRELASLWLALGFLPMLGVTVLFRKINASKVIFVPAGICAGFLIFWLRIAVIGICATKF